MLVSDCRVRGVVAGIQGVKTGISLLGDKVQSSLSKGSEEFPDTPEGNCITAICHSIRLLLILCSSDQSFLQASRRSLSLNSSEFSRGESKHNLQMAEQGAVWNRDEKVPNLVLVC
jgi:hypothetical protein